MRDRLLFLISLAFLLVLLLVSLYRVFSVDSFTSLLLPELAEIEPVCLEVDCADHDIHHGLPPASKETALSWKVDAEVITSPGQLLNLLFVKKFVQLDEALLQLHNTWLSGQISEFIYSEALGDLLYDAKHYEHLLPLVDEWIGQTDSAYAHIVKGYSLQSLGWAVRGEKYARDTDNDNLKTFKQYQRDALASFNAAFERAPDIPWIYKGVFAAEGCCFSGEIDREHWLKLLEQHSPHAYYPRVTLLKYLEPRWGGSYEEMRFAALQAQQFVDQNPRLRSLLGAEWADKGRRLYRDDEYEEAVKAYSAALYHGRLVTWLKKRGNAYWKLKQWSKLEQDALEALQIWPDYPWALESLAYSLDRQERLVEAEKAYQNAVGVMPNDFDLWKRWGWLALCRNDYPTAQERYSRAKEIAPDNINVHYWYSISLLEMNDERVVPAFKQYLLMCHKADADCNDEAVTYVTQFLVCVEEPEQCELEESHSSVIREKLAAGG